jgi:hypothetical protein
MDTTEGTTAAQDTATRLRTIADYLDTDAIDLPAPSVTVRWHLTLQEEGLDWRPVVRRITETLDAQWVAHHSGQSHWLETSVDTRIGPLVIFVPEDEPRPLVNPDLSEFTVAGRRRAAEA